MGPPVALSSFTSKSALVHCIFLWASRCLQNTEKWIFVIFMNQDWHCLGLRQIIHANSWMYSTSVRRSAEVRRWNQVLWQQRYSEELNTSSLKQHPLLIVKLPLSRSWGFVHLNLADLRESRPSCQNNRPPEHPILIPGQGRQVCWWRALWTRATLPTLATACWCA